MLSHATFSIISYVGTPFSSTFVGTVPVGRASRGMMTLSFLELNAAIASSPKASSPKALTAMPTLPNCDA